METANNKRLERRAANAARRIQANRHKTHSTRGMLAIAWSAGYTTSAQDAKRRPRRSPAK